MKKFSIIILSLLLATCLSVTGSLATITPNPVIQMQYVGSGSQVTFPYTWKIYANTDLVVVVTDATGDHVQALTTDYTVTGVGVSTGGNVVFGTAPTGTVTISLNLPLQQNLHYIPGAPFPAATSEVALDRLTMELRQYAGRTPLLDAQGILRDLTFPKPAYSSVIGWNATGTALQTYPTTSVAIPNIDYLGNYGNSLVTAVATIGSAPTLLMITQGTAVNADLVIPQNISLWLTPPGVITIASGKLLTINGGLTAGQGQQVFSGAGYPRFCGGSVGTIYPGWFGAVADYSIATDTGTDNTAAFNKAIISIALSNQSMGVDNSGATTLKIPPGNYKITGPINIANAAWTGITGLTSKTRCPLVVEGSSADSSFNTGGTILFKSRDANFTFMVGGDYNSTTGDFTKDAVGSGIINLVFKDFAICPTGPTWGDAAMLASVVATKPKGIGGFLQRARFHNVTFDMMYDGVDSYFLGSGVDHALVDRAKFDHCNWISIIHRGTILNSPDGTLLTACLFQANQLGVDDTGTEAVTACGIAAYNGSPTLLCCNFNYFGYTYKVNGTTPSQYDYCIFANAVYALDVFGGHSEVGRYLYGTTNVYGGGTPAELAGVINITGGDINYLKPDGIKINAMGKTRIQGVQFVLYGNADPTNIFEFDATDASVQGCKFRLPNNTAFTPTYDGSGGTVYIGDVAGKTADIGTIISNVAIGTSTVPVTLTHFGNANQYGITELQSYQTDGKGPHILNSGSYKTIPNNTTTTFLNAILANTNHNSYQVVIDYWVENAYTKQHGSVSFVIAREAGATGAASAVQQVITEQTVVTSGGDTITSIVFSLAAVSGGATDPQTFPVQCKVVTTDASAATLRYSVKAFGGDSAGVNSLTLTPQ